FYDPLSRLVKTELPNGTVRRVELDAWGQAEWDENDAIEGTSWLLERMALPPGDPERRAAELALAHANTPTRTHFDPLGRAYLQIEDNGEAGKYETRTELDILGNPVRVIDARGLVVEDRALDMLGRTLHLKSPDSGEKWTFPNCVDAPLRQWDGRGYEVRWAYDAAQRQTHVYVQAPGEDWRLAEYALYGERHPQAEAVNCRGAGPPSVRRGGPRPEPSLRPRRQSLRVGEAPGGRSDPSAELVGREGRQRPGDGPAAGSARAREGDLRL